MKAISFFLIFLCLNSILSHEIFELEIKDLENISQTYARLEQEGVKFIGVIGPLKYICTKKDPLRRILLSDEKYNITTKRKLIPPHHETKNLHQRFIVQLISIKGQKVLNGLLPEEAHPKWYSLGGDKYILTVNTQYSNITRFVLGSSQNVGFFDFIRDIHHHDTYAQEVVINGGEGSPIPHLPPTLTGEGTMVAVSDTGVDFSHPAFSRFKKSTFKYTGNNKNDILLGIKSRRDITPYIELHLSDGIESVETDNDDEHNGHGTAMSYLSVGSVPPLWISKSQFLFIDLMRGSDEHLILPPSLQDLLELLYDAGVRVFSNSWGSMTSHYTFQAMEFDEFSFLHDDFLFITSAGNSGPEERTITSPAVAKNGLSVGASQNSKHSFFKSNGSLWTLPYMQGCSAIGSCENVADFSSRGPTQDGRIKPDIVAPGEFILGARSHPIREECLYSYGRGTSPACQVVSRFVQFLREYLRKTYNMLSPTSSLIKATMIGLAKPMHGVRAHMMFSNKTNTYGAVFKTSPLGVFEQGFGRIYLPEKMDLFMKDRVPIATFQQRNYNITSLADGEITITLAWLDPPSTPYSDRKKDLINDLNLRVIKDDYLWLGNGEEDSLNNVERVKLFVKKGDLIQISVTPKGPLSPFKGIEPKFSLVVVGKVEEATFLKECTELSPPLQCPISGEIGGRGCQDDGKWKQKCHGRCHQKDLYWFNEDCKCLQDSPCPLMTNTHSPIRRCSNETFTAECPTKLPPKPKIRPPPRKLRDVATKTPHIWITWIEIFSISLFLLGFFRYMKKNTTHERTFKRALFPLQ